MDIASLPIVDVEIQEFIDSVLEKTTKHQIESVSHDDYVDAWKSWLLGSRSNFVQGLDLFPYAFYSAGVTPCFGEFISRYPGRRVRVSRNDFVMTKIMARHQLRKIFFLEDAELDPNDCLIVSMPFSGNGSRYPGLDDLLCLADGLEIPVMIDGAYFGISHDVTYALDHSCVTDFVVSHSKNFNVANLRIGIRFTKHPVDDSISAPILGADIFNKMSAHLGIHLMKRFSHDWFVSKYYSIRDAICSDLQISPTDTLTLGIGTDDMIEFKRGDYVRVCISQELSDYRGISR